MVYFEEQFSTSVHDWEFFVLKINLAILLGWGICSLEFLK